PVFFMGYGRDTSGGPSLFKSFGLSAEGASGISILTGIPSEETINEKWSGYFDGYGGGRRGGGGASGKF
ncbi:MAG: hypothetical protein ACFFDN_42615, partial [Candidatus Hodarchaeota archaeon]